MNKQQERDKKIVAAVVQSKNAEIASIRTENAEMLEALEDVWNDCEAAAKKGHAATFDAIRQRTFEKVKKSIAKAKGEHP